MVVVATCIHLQTLAGTILSSYHPLFLFTTETDGLGKTLPITSVFPSAFCAVLASLWEVQVGASC